MDGPGKQGHQATSCQMSTFKCTFLIFNAVSAILGTVSVIIAAVYMSTAIEFTKAKKEPEIGTDSVMIGIILLLILIETFGCFGSIKESPRLLNIYIGFLGVVIMFVVVAGVTGVFTRLQLEDTVQSHISESFNLSRSDVNHMSFWDDTQKRFKCCGISGPEDYYTPSNYSLRVVPLSCTQGCPYYLETEFSWLITDTIPTRQGCAVDRDRKDYEIGCQSKIMGYLSGCRDAIVVAGLLFCFTNIICIILAIRLGHAIRKETKIFTVIT